MRWAIAILALVIATNTFLLGTGKPVSGEYAVWDTAGWTRKPSRVFICVRRSTW